MTNKNNVKCSRKECKHSKGYYSRLFEQVKEMPLQCPRCKRYDTIEKI